MVKRKSTRNRNQGSRLLGSRKKGRGLWDTIKDSKIISGAASHIPFLGPIAGSLLGAFGLGHKRGRGHSNALVMPYRGFGAVNGRIDGSIGASNVGRVKF